MSNPIPLPGQHRPDGAGAGASADPDAVRVEVDSILAELSGCSGAEQAHDEQGDHDPGDESLTQDARLLDRAHEVLVRALSTVDKT